MNDISNGPNTTKFISQLKCLDPGDRARLKRNAGKSLAEAHDVIGLFYSLLPYGIPQSQEEIFFLVATLFPLAAEGNSGNFGDHLFLARNTKNEKGLDKRVKNLLDADLNQLHFRLRQAVHFLQSCRVSVNWQQLLSDLLYWDHADRYIQRRWARSYFGTFSEK